MSLYDRAAVTDIGHVIATASIPTLHSGP